MDNFNALSKSAILTKLALDGYFIDLLTLNSFIEKWHIEAIYENEFGIEFFDNNSYIAILNNLKNKYNETRQNLETSVKETHTEQQKIEEPKQEPVQEEQAPIENSSNEAQDAQELAQKMEEEYKITSIEDFVAEEPKQEPVQEEQAPVKNQMPAKEEYKEQAEEQKPAEQVYENSSVIQEHIQENVQISDFESEDDFSDSIMPAVMGALKPGPVAPGSTIHVDHDYNPKAHKTRPVQEIQEETVYEEATQVVQQSEQCDSDTNDILEGEFTQEEIEKANELMGGAEPTEEPVQEPVQEEAPQEEDELDLMQLAQSFAKNLTKGTEEKAEPADLDKIFEESYTEGFENLQEYTEETERAPRNTYYDLPAVKENYSYETANIDDLPTYETMKPAAKPEKQSQADNLSAQDIRDIIRDEISRQVPKNVPAAQNGDIKEIVTEIVKQTTEKMPQNAFKLDISNRTLDMVAKAIAKKIAVQLNDYYKLNINKQNRKLELFREKTIELKERNQALTEENRKLKAQLVETSRSLNCYKPTLFGLFKFETNNKTKKK